MFRSVSRGALLVAVTLIAAACGSSSSSQAPSSDPGATDAGSGKEYNIALVRWDAGDIFFNGVQYGEEQQIKAIEEANGVKINYKVVAANDAAQQLDGIRALMAQGIDGVSLVPWKGEALTSVLKELEGQNIPVVVHNLTVPESPFPFVAFANADAGRLAGEAIVAGLEESRGADWGKDGGVILLLRGDVTFSFDQERNEGYRSVFDKVTAQFPNVEIVERAGLGYQGEPARKAVEDAITRYGVDKILAVASVDGTMAVGGGVPALKTAGANLASGSENRVIVTSIDCSKPELESIAANELGHCSEQPAIAEGVLVQNLLYDMMSKGTIKPSEGAELVASWTDVPWTPVEVLGRDDITGSWFKTQAFAVPGTVPVDSEFHWANAGIAGG